MIPRARPNYGFGDLARAAGGVRGAGPATEALVQRLRTLLGLPHVALTPSGRGALYFLLKAAPQTEVIVPSYTCSAVAEAARLAGKELVYAEHGALSFNNELADLRPHLRSGRIYIATHQYGIAAPIEDLLAACRAAGVAVFEDIAAAFGTRVGGRPVGTFGDACFGSFDTTKLLNAPLKGGFFATADRDLFERASQAAACELRAMSLLRKAILLGAATALVCLRDPRLYKIFHTVYFRWCGRATAETGRIAERPNAFYREAFADWQARVVLPQLDRLRDTIARRRLNYRRLRDGLRELATLTLPPEDRDLAWAPIRFPVLCATDKMQYYEDLVRLGVDAGFSFTSITAPEAHRMAHTMAARVLNLPFDAALSSGEIDKVIRVLTELDGVRRG